MSMLLTESPNSTSTRNGPTPSAPTTATPTSAQVSDSNLTIVRRTAQRSPTAAIELTDGSSETFTA